MINHFDKLLFRGFLMCFVHHRRRLWPHLSVLASQWNNLYHPTKRQGDAFASAHWTNQLGPEHRPIVVALPSLKNSDLCFIYNCCLKKVSSACFAGLLFGFIFLLSFRFSFSPFCCFCFFSFFLQNYFHKFFNFFLLFILFVFFQKFFFLNFFLILLFFNLVKL